MALAALGTPEALEKLRRAAQGDPPLREKAAELLAILESPREAPPTP